MGFGAQDSPLGVRVRSVKFVYGTQGSNVIGSAVKAFVTGRGGDAGQARLAKGLDKTFDPGFRAKEFAHAQKDDVGGDGPRKGQRLGQMMDQYFADPGSDVHKGRDPLIGEFVHHAMRFRGKFDMNVPGWKAYADTFGGQRSSQRTATTSSSRRMSRSTVR